MNFYSPLAPLERERALFLYRNALDRGDAVTVDRVLEMAETDAVLESMIMESHAFEEQEAETVGNGWDVAEVRQALSFHLAPEILETNAPVKANAGLPRLTLADVAARMQADSAERPSHAGQPAAEFAHLTQRLRDFPLPLPGEMDERGVSELFQNLGIVASEQFQNGFRETALFLKRQQHIEPQ